MSDSSKPDDGDPVLTEWQSARDLVSTFDQRTHDLRQWGFSFITALLAAQSLLLPGVLGGSTSGSSITDSVKLGVLVVTLVLIVALRQVERNYQIYQKAANFRALILERELNIELGTTITDRYARYHMSRRVSAIYIAFALADGGLGFFVISDVYYWLVLALAVVVSAFLIVRIGESDLHFSRGEMSDWTFDHLKLNQGDELTITLTNMSETDPIELQAGDPICAFRNSPAAAETVPGPSASPKPPTFNVVRTQIDVRVEPLHFYSWTWPTGGLEVGVNQVFPTVDKDFFAKMNRKKKRHLDEAAKSLGLQTPAEMSGDGSQRLVYPVPLVRDITILADGGKALPA